MRSKSLLVAAKRFAALITVMIAVMMYASIASAANHTIVKITGTPIAIPGYNEGDTLTITGDALQTAPNDWTVLKNLTTGFALVMQNNQISIPANALDNSKMMLLDLTGLTNLSTIGGGAFYSSPLLKTANLSGLTQLTTLPVSLFQGCTDLETVNLSGLTNLTTIENTAFYDCSNLRTINLSGLINLRTIKNGAFSYCTSLETLNFSSMIRLESIESYAFLECSSLTTLDLSPLTNITTIGDGAFQDCTSLKTMDLSGLANLTTIGRWAFNGAPSLEGIAITTSTPPTLTADDAFNNTNECNIYVPTALVPAYKAAWPQYDHRIFTLGITAPPTANPPGGTFTGPPVVTLSSTTPGATIFYTLDGSDPITNPNGTRQTYTTPITVALGTTLKFFARAINAEPSSVTTAVFSQQGGGGGKIGTVATPIATPPGGIFSSAQTVTLTSATPGATIYYTLDCSDPITSPTRQKYTAPIVIPMGTMLKAYAVKSGMYDSALLIQCYTQAGTVAMPIASPPGGLFQSAQTVYLSSETPDTVIYYTLDGSDPGTNPNGTRQTYGKPLHIPLGTTLKAYAEKGGLLRSAVLTETYTLYNESCGSGGGCNGGISAASLGLLLAGAVLLGKKKR